MPEGFDLSQTYVHVGDGARATPVEDFEWTPAFLEAYTERFREDGPSSLLVCAISQRETWTTWERHPAGDEIVVLVSGRVDVIQEVQGREELVELRPGQALINPRGTWHRSVVHEPGLALFMTPGAGTEHRSYEG